MINYKLTGHILPKHRNITMPPFKAIRYQDKELDLLMEFSISIVDSKIDVDCTVNRLGPVENAKVANFALQLIRTALNLISFNEGILLSPTLDYATLPDGSIKHLEAVIPGLGDLCTSYKASEQVPVKEVSNSRLRWVLRDLIGALEQDMATINCARAMDGIRNLIASPEASERQAWAEMREKLRIDEKYLKYITQQSRDHRHAKYTMMLMDEVLLVLRRSWTVMDRYFHYQKRGGTEPLPEAEFPILEES